MIRLAAVQFRSVRDDLATSRETLCRLVERALVEDARWVVCPELAVTGYVFDSRDEADAVAETPTGPTQQAMSVLARRYRAHIVYGFIERDGDLLYNSQLWVGPDGTTRAVYRKVLLFELDLLWAEPGASRALWLADGLSIVPGVCMDLNDLGYTRFVSANDPDLVVFSTNWLNEGASVLPYWLMRLGTWNGAFVAANTWGSDRGVTFRGQSAILNAGRAVVVAPLEGDCVIVASVTPHRRRRERPSVIVLR